MDVVGLTSGVAAVSAGFFHTCALTTAGGLKCWGSNDFGELGDGTTTLPTTPVDASGLHSGVAAVSAGGGYTCALTTAGGLKCWGGSTYGRLGDATTSGRPRPVDVCATGATFPCTAVNNNILTGVAAVSAGIAHTCAVTTAGGVKCWGGNLFGQLGNGEASGIHSTTPVNVIGFVVPPTPAR